MHLVGFHYKNRQRVFENRVLSIIWTRFGQDREIAEICRTLKAWPN